ncbi:hypothetical protein DYB37_009699 [Aphanomyces astaci]|uniref:Temptin Cys/Cys disulfide domain-containing protein n=1 Tax=Aphanomyces astaci TaxID=112090 RepID=A0A397BNN3_APHAT|nr:hypothetical protein AaE_008850 [Aphanomyces astaci]RHY08470.1 hypothetical protein DYB36_004937 [Aphanomyces astaci]RHY21205.1 hypothetical protein DYB25_010286 [Aphanomyces astaci]RHY41587.1 hypothetical protein DYB34_011493 [Aphanomyces astaci]RHY56358.1 hypothetical protein DYB30_007472 [Aphanomyces astaci]
MRLHNLPLLVVVALATTGVLCRPQYAALIPNGDNVDGYPAVGHTNDAGGGDRNAFGKDFSSAGSWTVALCKLDSDGDGLTNGQELGDPCCVWVKGTTPNQTVALSNPGLTGSTRDRALATSVTCPDGSPAASLHASSWLVSGIVAGVLAATL